MGATKFVDTGTAPLMTPSGYIAVAADEAAAANEGLQVPSRHWDGSLLACCGSCDFVGLGSCLLSKYLPCVAFGQNAKRAFKQSAWLHGLTYLALFMVVGWLSLAFLMSANHNVLAQCNGDLPAPPRDSFWLQSSQQWDAPANWGSDSLSFRGLGEKHDDHHHHDDDGNDGDHHKHHDDGDDDNEGDHHKHHDHDDDDEGDDHHKHKDDAKHDKKPCKDSKGKHSDAAAVVDGKLISKAVAHGKAEAQTTVSSLENSVSKNIKAVSDQASRKHGPDSHSDRPRSGTAGHRSQEELLASPECQEAVMVYCGAWLAFAVSILLAVLYAARRRSLLRQRFGIAGSKLGDFCTWCWCAPCALCQETRTLWTNNVNDGVWQGAGPYTAVPNPATVPEGQFMTAHV